MKRTPVVRSTLHFSNPVRILLVKGREADRTYIAQHCLSQDRVPKTGKVESVLLISGKQLYHLCFEDDSFYRKQRSKIARNAAKLKARSKV